MGTTRKNALGYPMMTPAAARPYRGWSYMPSPSPTPEFEGPVDHRPPRNRVATPTRPVHNIATSHWTTQRLPISSNICRRTTMNLLGGGTRHLSSPHRLTSTGDAASHGAYRYYCSTSSSTPSFSESNLGIQRSTAPVLPANGQETAKAEPSNDYTPVPQPGRGSRPG